MERRALAGLRLQAKMKLWKTRFGDANKQRTFSKFCGNRNEKMLAEKIFPRTVIRLYDYFFSGRAK
jgi:hypothetical protein